MSCLHDVRRDVMREINWLLPRAQQASALATYILQGRRGNVVAVALDQTRKHLMELTVLRALDGLSHFPFFHGQQAEQRSDAAAAAGKRTSNKEWRRGRRGSQSLRPIDPRAMASSRSLGGRSGQIVGSSLRYCLTVLVSFLHSLIRLLAWACLLAWRCLRYSHRLPRYSRPRKVRRLWWRQMVPPRSIRRRLKALLSS